MKNAKDYVEEGKKYYYQQSKYKEAKQSLQKAIDIDTKYSDAYSELANLENVLGSKNHALKLITKAIELTPQNTKAHYFKARILADSKKIQDMESFNKAEELAIQNVSTESSETYIAKGDYLNAKYKIEKDLIKKQQYKTQALTYYTKITEEDFYFEYSLLRKSTIILDYNQELNNSDLEDILNCFNDILSKQRSERLSEVHDKIAQILEKLDNQNEAIKSYLIAVNLYKKDGYYKQVLTCYDKLTKLDPTQKVEYSKQRTQIFNLLHYGDDSSDEEIEAKIYEMLPASEFYQQDTTLIPPSDIKWSLIMQELGTRLLISNPVRKLYFAVKSKIGEFNNLPNDNDMRKVFTDTILNLVQNGDIIINDVVFKEYLTTILINNKKSLLTLRLKEMKQDLEKLFEIVLSKAISEPVRGMYERHVHEVVNQLQKEAGNIEMDKYYEISSSAKIKQKINSFFANKNSDIAKTIHSILTEKVVDWWNTITVQKLKELAVEKLISNKTEETINFNDFTFELEAGIKALQNQLLRPILSDSTSMSAKDFNDSGDYTGAEMLFSHVRLNHLSAKRYIKNKKLESNFDGANFSRGWQFDPEKQLSVIEQQELSGTGKAITALVQYPYDSSYSKLLTKLKQFQKNTKLTDQDIITKGIVSILKTGELDPSLHISIDFERFLTVFTYHLFDTEVQRHPAAAIHNAIALDLISKHNYGLEKTLEYLPMAIEGAVKVARALQTSLQQKVSIPYFYDKASGTRLCEGN